MSELRLDYQHKLSLTWAGLILLGAVLIALIFVGIYWLELRDQTNAWESKYEQVHSKAAAREVAEKSVEHGTADLSLEVKNANDVLRQMSIPWDSLFEAVESSAGGKVTLLELEPDIEKREVKINGETKDYKTLMSYIMKLEGYPVFGSVYLQNHHVQLQDPDKPVRFSLLATWQETPR